MRYKTKLKTLWAKREWVLESGVAEKVKTWKRVFHKILGQ